MSEYTLSGPEASPLSGGKAESLILFLHGLGADGNDLFGLKDPFAKEFPNAHIASPNAPFPCDMAPYGYQWFSLQERSNEKLLYGVKQAEPYLNKFIDDKLADLGLTIDSLAIIGFSQGTMTALYTMPRREKPCAAIIGFSGAMVGGELLQNEIKSRPPTCLIHGDSDMVVPYQAMAEAASALKASKITFETHTRQKLGHGIDMEGVGIAIEFLRKHL